MGDQTTIQLGQDTRDQLQELKPFDSVSYDDLLDDMIAVYTAEKPRPRHVQAAAQSAARGRDSDETDDRIKTTPGGAPE